MDKLNLTTKQKELLYEIESGGPGYWHPIRWDEHRTARALQGRGIVGISNGTHVYLISETPDIWQEVDAFITEHESKYDLSFGLEYSSVVDWVCDITPRRNHPRACEYGLWQGQAPTRDKAIRIALDTAGDSIQSMKES